MAGAQFVFAAGDSAGLLILQMNFGEKGGLLWWASGF